MAMTRFAIRTVFVTHWLENRLSDGRNQRPNSLQARIRLALMGEGAPGSLCASRRGRLALPPIPDIETTGKARKVHTLARSGGASTAGSDRPSLRPQSLTYSGPHVGVAVIWTLKLRASIHIPCDLHQTIARNCREAGLLGAPDNSREHREACFWMRPSSDLGAGCPSNTLRLLHRAQRSTFRPIRSMTPLSFP